MKRILVIALLLAGVVGADFDQSWLKLSYGMNSKELTKKANAMWLARRADMVVASYPARWDSIYTICRDSGKSVWVGPYASSQEINMTKVTYSPPYPSYATRLADTASFFQYIYAKAFLDSIGLNAETLVVHIADDSINITQNGDGARAYNLTALNYSEKRFCYQYWNNNSADTFLYPSGYTNLANGYNLNVRRALAYAYVHYLIEDTAKSWGPPVSHSFHYNCYFMDNQYREGGMPRMSSYYTINGTSGGTTSGLDWVEQPGIQTSQDSIYKYFDNSTMGIDSAIHAALDSVCTAKGWPQIYGFANVNKFDPTHLYYVIKDPHVNGVSLENPIDYGKSPSNWRNWYAMADTMRNHPEVQVNWGISYDILLSTNPASWLYDTTRLVTAHLAFYLTVFDTNSWMSPHNWQDTTYWYDIYTVNFGWPDGAATTINTTGNSDYGGTPYIYVKRRYLDDSNIVAMFRTANSAAGYTTDSVSVDLGGTYYEIEADGDTASSPVTSIYMKPYEGWIGTESAPGSAPDPEIALYPNTFSPTATVGSDNPSDDSIVVTNTGGGALSWTATKINSWLSIAPTTGGNSDTIIFSISISGLSAGIYYDTITVTDAAASNSPQKAPITLTIESAPVGVQGKVLRGKVYLKGKVKI